MNINLILLGQFMRKHPTVLSGKGRAFLSGVLGNPTVFINPLPAGSVITNSIDELDSAAQAYEASARPADKLVMQAKQTILEGNLRQFATYANTVANGNRIIASLTSMELRKEPSPQPPISFVSTPLLTTGTTGKMRSRTEAVVGARMYKHCITDDLSIPVTQWVMFESTKATFTFVDLVPGKIYHVCTAASGIDQQCVFSDYATKMAV